MPAKKNIKVLIVDDSAVVRQKITKILSEDPAIEVVGTAGDPYFARDKIIKLKPDVLTLDIEMPRMDGLTFLKILMEQNPLPTIIISSLSVEGSRIALEALNQGAVDVMAKPGTSFNIGEIGPQLIEKVKAAALSRVHMRRPATPSTAVSEKKAEPPQKIASSFDPRQLVVMGGSTGGTEAIKEVITKLPADMPGILIVQHIPPHFSTAWADRLNSLSRLSVREAEDGDRLYPGQALIAPGNYHMTASWTGAFYRIHLNQGPMVWHQRPAVDILFKSVASTKGGRAVACALLTGMGKDGAEGMLKLREAGASTMTQSEDTCVVYGMPRAADELGASQRQIPLGDMAGALQNTVKNYSRQTAST